MQKSFLGQQKIHGKVLQHHGEFGVPGNVSPRFGEFGGDGEFPSLFWEKFVESSSKYIDFKYVYL